MGAPSQPTVQGETDETDLTDEQWEQIRPFVEVQAKTGPKRRVNVRAVLNGLLYKLKTGCQWEVLPRSFPPKRTVHYFCSMTTNLGLAFPSNVPAGVIMGSGKIGIFMWLMTQTWKTSWWIVPSSRHICVLLERKKTVGRRRTYSDAVAVVFPPTCLSMGMVSVIRSPWCEWAESDMYRIQAEAFIAGFDGQRLLADTS